MITSEFLGSGYEASDVAVVFQKTTHPLLECNLMDDFDVSRLHYHEDTGYSRGFENVLLLCSRIGPSSCKRVEEVPGRVNLLADLR